jgi:putative transposase
MMATYTELGAVVTMREAAGLTGVSRATAHRHDTAAEATRSSVRPAPANRLDDGERARILGVLNSDRFVDTTPVEVFATLLDEGVYLASVATLYRVLRENQQVVERRRQARHPARKRPELTATGPGQVFTWDITKLAGPTRGLYYDAYVMISTVVTSSGGRSPRPSPPSWPKGSSPTCSPSTASRRSFTPIGERL